MSRLVLPLAAVVSLLVTPALVHAQASVTASISGTVIDPAGGVLPGATVVVTEVASGTTYETVSNRTGTFSVPALNPGTYRVTVSLTGFKTSVTTTSGFSRASPLRSGRRSRSGRSPKRSSSRAASS